MDVRKEVIPLLCSTIRETALAKGFRFNMMDTSTRVSAEVRSCLEWEDDPV